MKNGEMRHEEYMRKCHNNKIYSLHDCNRCDMIEKTYLGV